MDDRLTILNGDALTMLRDVPDCSVQCCVTSPPYWGLRDYGHAGQLGLEKTPQEYVEKMVALFREVRRVLKDDGTCWINLGDSYCGGGNNRGNGSPISAKQASNGGATGQVGAFPIPPGLKPKDRMLLPARVAIALCESGWWIRDEIIWHKPNPMPAPDRGRTTPSHEMIYMLSKNERYFYDTSAIAEPIAESSIARYAQASVDSQPGGFKQDAYESGITGARARSRRPNEIIKDLARKHNNQSEKLIAGSKWQARHEGWDAIKSEITTRIKRSVWTVPTLAFSEAHFATYPPDLIKPCILAGSKPGDVVLDPFAGSGTTGMVALELGRKALLVELNPEYCKLIERRCDVTPGFAF